MFLRNEVPELKVEVWSDFVCPFCYIGKRHLEKALEQFPHKENVTIEYRAYELDQHAEKTPKQTIHESLAHKYSMSVDKAMKMNESVRVRATEVGLTYNFDLMKPANTFDAHRVTKFASFQGKEEEMTERLLKGYFTDSELIGDHDTLVDLASDVGLNREEVRKVLESDDYSDDVRHDEKVAKQIGVEGVPFFVFNEEYAISGAQPINFFIEVIEKVWEEFEERARLEAINPKKSKTTYCTDEGCYEED